MAQFIDLRFEELVTGAPRVIREGLTGTKTMVLPEPDPNRALIVEYNGTGRVIGTWPIKKGWAYRITPGKVRRLPFLEKDQNFPRRFCRTEGMALTLIVKATRGEDTGCRYLNGKPVIIQEGDPAVIYLLQNYLGAAHNPPTRPALVIIEREITAKTYEEFLSEIEVR